MVRPGQSRIDNPNANRNTQLPPPTQTSNQSNIFVIGQIPINRTNSFAFGSNTQTNSQNVTGIGNISSIIGRAFVFITEEEIVRNRIENEPQIRRTQ